MSTALIYRSRGRGLTWVAFVCAVTAHIGAVLIAAGKPDKSPPVISPPPGDNEVIAVDDVAVAPETPPPEQVVASHNDSDFVEDNSIAPLTPKPKKKNIATILRSIVTGPTGISRFASVKSMVLDAPRPAYPYEARERHIMGSGVARLTINPSSGMVVSARMNESTGSGILDNAAVAAFRRWKFRPGAPESVEVPITYTLTGVSY